MKISLSSAVLIALLIANIIVLGYFIWTRVGLSDSDSNYSKFNNIGTPIIAFLSLIVYALALFVTMQQTKIAQAQSAIAISEALRPLIEFEFETIKRELNEDIRGEYAQENGEPFVSGKSVYKRLIEITNELPKNTDYIKDWEEWEVGVYQTRKYFSTRTYFKELCILFEYSKKGEKFSERVLNLFSEIDKIDLTPEYKLYYKRKIKEELLKDYFKFIEIDVNFQTPITFPTLNNPEYQDGKFIDRGDKISWIYVKNISLFKDYSKLKVATSNLVLERKE